MAQMDGWVEETQKTTKKNMIADIHHAWPWLTICRASAQGILGHGPGRWQGRGRQDVEIREIHEVSARRIHLTDVTNWTILLPNMSIFFHMAVSLNNGTPHFTPQNDHS